MSDTNAQQYPNSLLKKFRKAILWLYLVSIAISIPVLYAATYYQAHGTADKELSLLVDMVSSLRKFIAEDVRADLMKANLFQSPAISSTVTTAKVATHFRKLRPEYYIKVASDNPLNPKNKPEPLEKEVLDRFRADKKLERIVEVGTINNKQYLVSSRPSVAHEECLICHGEPRSAPEAVKTAYGTVDGFHYKVGDVVGTMVVGVPLSDVNALVINRSLVALGVFTLIFGAIFLTVSAIVKRQIVQPVKEITGVAIALSQGDLSQNIEVNRDGSEIGELGHAFLLVQRSLSFAMKKLKEGQ